MYLDNTIQLSNEVRCKACQFSGISIQYKANLISQPLSLTLTWIDCALMSYIKIYPKSLNILSCEDNTYTAKVLFDLEQYGHLYPKLSFNVSIHKSEKTREWTTLSTQDHPQIKNFDSFLKALSFYIFQTLKVQPPVQLEQSSPVEIELREVYFALDPQSPPTSPNYVWDKIKK